MSTLRHSPTRAIPLLCALLAVSCATAPDGSSRPDGRVVGTAVGAVAGCALAQMVGAKCAEGAVVGGAVGLAVGWQYESRKVADAQAVNARYAKAGVAIPDGEVRVQRHTVAPTPGSVVKPGEAVSLVGNIDLIGNSRSAPALEEKVTLLSADGKEYGTKSTKLENVDGAGSYVSRASYTFPRGASGRYTAKTQLYLNGKMVSQRDTPLQVV